MIKKTSIILLIFFFHLSASAQIDFKNSLNDLKYQLGKSKTDTQQVRLALRIASFFFTNKIHSAATIDSSNTYLSMAENLSNQIQFRQGMDDAAVIRISLLMATGRIKEAENMVFKSSGPLYCRLALIFGCYFLAKDGEYKVDLDIAGRNFRAAETYARQKNMPILLLTARIYTYKLMLERGTDAKIADRYLQSIVNQCRAYHSKPMEAQALLVKGIYDVYNLRSAAYLKKACSTAASINDKATVASCLNELADFNLREGKLDTAEMQLKQAIQVYKEMGYKNMQSPFDLLAAVHTKKGNFETAMRYGLNALNYAEQTGTEINVQYLYYRLANLCRDMGLNRESVVWYEKSMKAVIKAENRFPFLIYRVLAADLIAHGKAREVLKTVAFAEKNYPDNRASTIFIPLVRADCYLALGKPELAEHHYLKLIADFNKFTEKDAYYYSAYKCMAAFYIQQKAFSKAEHYVDKVLSAKQGLVTITDLADVEQFKFRTDSARGNYLQGIQHFENSKRITDSIFNQVRLKQTEQLQLQYTTAKRDQENLRLRNRNTLQHSELEKEALQKKIISIGLLGAVMVISLMIYLYKVKQKSNKDLKRKQQKIGHQNNRLNELLKEKEWLMKEIHHRVKNNLQIISSLLNTQSSFLENEQAITAIKDSQNRLQAISILHQKLYQSHDLSTVNLPAYIEELAHGISESLNTYSSVRFIFDIADIALNATETVPLGLILNEAITNSIKYAFAGNTSGTIAISLHENTDGTYALTIIDNGKGLPKNFDSNTCSSLGMNLMAGLSNQLMGTFEIYSEKGTVINITFCAALENEEGTFD